MNEVYHTETVSFLYHIWCGILTIIITQSVLRQVRSLFQSKFSRACYLVLTLSSSSIFSFPYDHRVAAYSFFLIVSSSKELCPTVSGHWKQLTASRNIYTRFFRCLPAIISGVLFNYVYVSCWSQYMAQQARALVGVNTSFKNLGAISKLWAQEGRNEACWGATILQWSVNLTVSGAFCPVHENWYTLLCVKKLQ